MAWEEVHQGEEQARGQERGKGSVTKRKGNPGSRSRGRGRGHLVRGPNVAENEGNHEQHLVVG